ncbi:MAG: GAF domain-containing protein [Pseudonocardiaceae bacterium]
MGRTTAVGMGEQGWFGGPRTSIEGLIRDLLDRADEVLGAQTRLRGLLDAVVTIAVENARLYESGRRRQRCLEISSQLATDLLRGMGRDEALEHVAASARGLAGADLGSIVVPDPATGDLRVAAAAGSVAADVRGARISSERSFSASVMASGKPELVPDARADPRTDLAALSARWGPLLLVPLASRSGTLGVLVVAKQAGAKPFDTDDVASTTGFATQAALALELARARDDRERLALLEDRDRIARDLHDLVIQRLFATGLGLQGTARMTRNPELAQRLSAYVAALDDTIREIRQAIFSLRSSDEKGASLRQDVLGVLREAAQVVGFEPAVRFEGPVDSAVPTAVVPQLTAVLREALTNIGRHAGASSARVELAVTGTMVRLTVRDDGVGLPEQRHESGLGNLARRAEELGGWLDAHAVGPHGTELVWQVPLTP